MCRKLSVVRLSLVGRKDAFKRKGEERNPPDARSLAENKRSKWLTIPAFLVTLVHANQKEGWLLLAVRTTCYLFCHPKQNDHWKMCKSLCYYVDLTGISLVWAALVKRYDTVLLNDTFIWLRSYSYSMRLPVPQFRTVYGVYTLKIWVAKWATGPSHACVSKASQSGTH
jgi:hypothetical protein